MNKFYWTIEIDNENGFLMNKFDKIYYKGNYSENFKPGESQEFKSLNFNWWIWELKRINSANSWF